VGGKLVRAHNAFVNEAILSTSIENQGVKISTVEHLMSAFSALGIDNVLVELDSFEVPIMDGSSAPFIFLVQSAGIEDQNAHKKFFVIKDTIRYWLIKSPRLQRHYVLEPTCHPHPVA
jgi:UDP-3-O-[3-hydroxymyristoyl] N-acetylglucosamine deacetylase